MSLARKFSIALLLTTIVPPAQAAGNPERGRTLFSHCAACHANTTQNKIGPGLAGVFGRVAGTVPGFRYSKAMVGYAKRWDDQTLDSFLAVPATAVPGTTMLIGVPSASDRADIIAYLKTIDAQ